MKHYYSFEAFSEREVAFPEYRVAVGRGVNAFTLATDDVDGVIAHLLKEGIRVIKVYVLSGVADTDQIEFLRLQGGET